MIIIFMVTLIKARLAWSLLLNSPRIDSYSESYPLDLGAFHFLVLTISLVRILLVGSSRPLVPKDCNTSDYFATQSEISHF